MFIYKYLECASSLKAKKKKKTKQTKKIANKSFLGCWGFLFYKVCVFPAQSKVLSQSGSVGGRWGEKGVGERFLRFLGSSWKPETLGLLKHCDKNML